MQYTPSHLNFYILSGYCNARCIMCPVHESEKVIMSWEDYTGVVDNCANHVDKVEFFTLSAMGEPLMHKDVVRMVEYARDKGFKNLGMITNASLLTPEKSRQLIEAGLNTLMISIDAATEESYARLEKGFKLADIQENVKGFIAARDELGKPARVIVKFLQQDANEGEWPQFKEFWEQHTDPEKRDEIVKTGLHNWGGQLSENVNQAKVLCKELQKYLHVSPTGEAMLCCAAPAEKFHHGNLLSDDMMELYNCEYFSRFRRGFLNKDQPLIEPCDKCNFPVEYGY
ncbi:radical SAM/SPASM domain-containing protein [Pseudodesulfovibrio sp. zrk46]|uniref:radical SAM protein n=1 Tax=Pseudodesulfovibrio sp. zrk46 TaxID=2725288 RepID=UPI001449101D|nr:radical SAM/SPASM domain-containing protein [Pseudodesulfovibrio sp. zrk46]QJB55742.1 radical SAM protein [Pseudodesulfovibrio sp. zrk46]